MNNFGYNIGKFGQLLNYFHGFKYVEDEGGRTEEVIIEYLKDTCNVHIDGQICSRCELTFCNHETSSGHLFRGIRADCENIEAGASFDQCGESYVDKGVLEIGNDEEFNQCIVPQSPEAACQTEGADAQKGNDGTTCDCTISQNGGFELNCVKEGCIYCSSDRSSCGYDVFGSRFNRLGHRVSTFNGVKFIRGRNNQTMIFEAVSDPRDSRDCMMTLDGEECNRCSIVQCSQNIGLRIDCENLETGAVVDQCEPTEDIGVLEYFSPHSFVECLKTLPPIAAPSFGPSAEMGSIHSPGSRESSVIPGKFGLVLCALFMTALNHI
jgi:hypothetical protein